MKRIMLALIMAMTMTGCGGGGDPQQPGKDHQPAKDAPPARNTPAAPGATATVYGKDLQKKLADDVAGKGIDATMTFLQEINTFDGAPGQIANWPEEVRRSRESAILNQGVIVEFALAQPRKVTLTLADGSKADANVTHVLLGSIKPNNPYPSHILVQTEQATYMADKYGVPASFEAWVKSAKLHE